MSSALLTDHVTHGLVARTRWEHGIAAERPPLPARWVYSETRVVVILDLRRDDLVWSRRAIEVLDCVLASLGAGPAGDLQLLGEQLPSLAVHVTVALSAREGWPLRVLIQGYRLRCGAPVDSLGRLVHEQLALALAEPAVTPDPVASNRGLHGCVRDGLFCLSLLPAVAAPALAVITDAVGALLDAPLIALRQLDVALLIVLCMECSGVGGHGRAGGRGSVGGHGRRLIAPLGLIPDPSSHQRAVQLAAGLLLLPTPTAEGPSAGRLAPHACIANALMMRPQPSLQPLSAQG